MEVWFRLSLGFTVLAWTAVVVGIFMLFYCHQSNGATAIVLAAPLALVSSVSTFMQWRATLAHTG